MDGVQPDTRSLYRVYRPQTFSELRGQGHVARTLANAVRNGSVAHGYVFAGPRGTGKTSTARILAKALNCAGPDGEHRLTSPTPEPCGVCAPCREIAAGACLDVIEMDAASNRSIDDVRDLRDTIAFAPVRDRFKVYIIDEAHMLTREAFNALLKTLEEPPPNVVFVLATTEPHKLPDTIVSRCQRFDFHRPTMQQIVALLTAIAAQEEVEIDEEALETIAEHAQGGFRDAIGALDRLRSFAEGRIHTDDVLAVLGVTDTQLLIEITDIVVDRDPSAALAFVHRLYERGVNFGQFIADLLRHLRRLFLLQHLLQPGEDPALLRALGQNVGLHPSAIARLQPQAHQFTPAALIRFMDLLGHAQSEIKAGLDGRLQLELALVKLTRPHLELSLEGLDERLRRLEGELTPADAGRHPAGSETRRDTAPPRGAGRPAAAPAEPIAPRAVPSSEPAAPQSATADDQHTGSPLEQITRAWPVVLERVRTRSGPLGALLRDAVPVDADETRIVVGVPAPFICERLREQGDGDSVAQTVADVLGAPKQMEYVVSGTPTPRSEADAPVTALTDAQRIALIQRELDAELLTDDH